MSDKYYVAGCVDNGLSAEVVEDEHAEFWTLYERDSEGLSEAIIDCVSRKEAETAMAVYVERDRLNEQVRALAAENAALRNLQPTELMISSAHAEAEEYDNSNLDDDLIVFMWQAMHSQIKTPATDAILREVGADAIDGFAADLYRVANDHVRNGRRKNDVVNCRAAAKADEDYAARIRAGEQP